MPKIDNEDNLADENKTVEAAPKLSKHGVKEEFYEDAADLENSVELGNDSSEDDIGIENDSSQEETKDSLEVNLNELKESTSDQIDVESDEIFQCEQCDKKLRNKRQLKKHRKSKQPTLRKHDMKVAGEDVVGNKMRGSNK